MCKRADAETRSLIEESASQANIDPNVLEAAYITEGGGRVAGTMRWDKSHVTYGSMQISEDVARAAGVPGPFPRTTSSRPVPTDAPAAQPKYNMLAAAKYLGKFQGRCNGNATCMYDGYNAGTPGRVSQSRPQIRNFNDRYQCVTGGEPPAAVPPGRDLVEASACKA